MKTFPIMRGTIFGYQIHHPKSIPWELAERHRRAIEVNGGYSLEVIAKRGGLDIYHLYAALTDRVVTQVWHSTPPDELITEDDVILYIVEAVGKFVCDCENRDKAFEKTIMW